MYLPIIIKYVFIYITKYGGGGDGDGGVHAGRS